jgi:hypothetical protein
VLWPDMEVLMDLLLVSNMEVVLALTFGIRL